MPGNHCFSTYVISEVISLSSREWDQNVDSKVFRTVRSACLNARPGSGHWINTWDDGKIDCLAIQLLKNTAFYFSHMSHLKMLGVTIGKKGVLCISES